MNKHIFNLAKLQGYHRVDATFNHLTFFVHIHEVHNYSKRSPVYIQQSHTKKEHHANEL